MEPINAAKLQDMNNYKKSTTTTTTTTTSSQFFKKFILYSLISLVSGLVCSYPYWFPSLCFSMKHFLFTSLPCIWYFLINAKCLFIVGNFIVIILIGESKLACSRNPVAEVYDEYVKRSSRIRSAVIIGEKKKLEDQREVKKIEEGLYWIKEDNEENNKEDKEEEEENSDEDDKEIDGEEESGLPAEELNKRVEEFIAKVNKQRCLEAKL